MLAWQTALNEFSVDHMTQGYIDLIARCIELRKRNMDFKRNKVIDLCELGPHPNVLNFFLKIKKRIEIFLEKSGLKQEKILPVA